MQRTDGDEFIDADTNNSDDFKKMKRFYLQFPGEPESIAASPDESGGSVPRFPSRLHGHRGSRHRSQISAFCSCAMQRIFLLQSKKAERGCGGSVSAMGGRGEKRREGGRELAIVCSGQTEISISRSPSL